MCSFCCRCFHCNGPGLLKTRTRHEVINNTQNRPRYSVSALRRPAPMSRTLVTDVSLTYVQKANQWRIRQATRSTCFRRNLPIENFHAKAAGIQIHTKTHTPRYTPTHNVGLYNHTQKKVLTFNTAFGTELKQPVAAGLGGPGLTITVGSRAMRPSTYPFLRTPTQTKVARKPQRKRYAEI